MRENTIPAEKTSQTSRIWGKPNRALIRSFGFWLFNANVIDNYTSVQGMVTIVTTSKSCASCIVFLTSMGLAWLGS